MRPIKSTSYDGIYYAKIAANAPINYNLENTVAFKSVCWGSANTIGAYGLDLFGRAEFQTLKSVFNFYRIQGMQIKIFPASNLSGDTNIRYFDTNVASFPDH